MAKQGWSAPVAGAWLVAAAALAGLAVSIFNYFDPQSGIAGEPGTMLVIVSTALLALAGLLLSGNRLGGFLRGFFALAALLDLVGTALAAYMLHSWSLVALMIIGLAGWLLYVMRPRSAATRQG
jgi:hypothetical protein